MANRDAYGEEACKRIFLPDRCTCDVSAVWMKNNANPALDCLRTVLRTYAENA